jgi:hypothetical protein
MLSLLVVNAARHCGQWIFFSTIFTTYPAIYDIAASLYSDSPWRSKHHISRDHLQLAVSSPSQISLQSPHRKFQ